MHGASSLQNVMILQDLIVQENLNNITTTIHVKCTHEVYAYLLWDAGEVMIRKEGFLHIYKDQTIHKSPIPDPARPYGGGEGEI